MAFGICSAAFAQTEDTEALKDKLYTSIIQAYNAKNWTEVNDLIGQLVAAGASIDELEITYAEALGELGRGQEGIDRLNAYLKNTPDDFRAYQVLGELYENAGNTGKAIEAYEKCASIRPDFAKPMVSAARLQASSDPQAAMKNYNKAITVFINANRPDGAIQIGTEAMKVDPQNIDFLMLMGDALTRANMPDNALSFYAEVITVNNRNPQPDPAIALDANYNIAMIYYKKHEYTKALVFLNSLVTNTELEKSSPEAYALAMCLSAACENRRGNSSGAEECLAKARLAAPENWQRDYEAFLSLE